MDCVSFGGCGVGVSLWVQGSSKVRCSDKLLNTWELSERWVLGELVSSWAVLGCAEVQSEGTHCAAPRSGQVCVCVCSWPCLLALSSCTRLSVNVKGERISFCMCMPTSDGMCLHVPVSYSCVCLYVCVLVYDLCACVCVCLHVCV